MSLRIYNRKRKFEQTPEPKGKVGKKGQGNLRFVVQMHYASRLHFDLRLEFEGVFKSWAVPKVPSLNPQDQRLAVFVEDHPLDYGSFEGIIPKNNYGAGTVMVWDEGTYVERGSENRKQSELAMRKGFDKGHMTFVLDGHKLKGEFALIQLKKDGNQKAWLLVKKRDEFSTFKRDQKIDSLSVKTGRSIEEIAAQSEKRGHVWMPKQKKQGSTVQALTKSAPVKKTTPKKAHVKKNAEQSERNAQARPEPMPRKIKPMLASRGGRSAINTHWMFEPYQGGLRAIAEVEPHRVHLYSKSGLSFDKKFPEILAALKQLKTPAVLDGEIIQVKKASRYLVRDLLYFDGRDLRKLPLSERRHVLEDAIPEDNFLQLTRPLAVSKKHPLPSGEWLALNPESLYRPGISSDWQMIQHQSDQTPSKKSGNPPFRTTAPGAISRPARATNSSEPRLTNLEKIYFPEDGLTKGDVINYYKQVAPMILPYL
ncbi:MAG: hypothetical protein K2X47_10280, partial [Bdellovibrionales bacterium]|nr:hypothetical protein [Bdellovibrionales bacterium]